MKKYTFPIWLFLFFCTTKGVAQTSSPSQTNENAKIEEDIFSAPSVEPVKNTDLVVTSKTSLPPKTLAIDSEQFSVGGRVDWQLTTTYIDNTPIGKQNILTPLTGIFNLDGRPTPDLRSFLQVRINYASNKPETNSTTTTISPNNSINNTPNPTYYLDGLWIKFDANKQVFFTLGKQPLKWGTGRIWNPVDFLHHELKDVFSKTDDRQGLNLIKVQYPFEKSGSNLYFISKYEGASQINNLQHAIRAEIVAHNSEWGLTFAIKRKEKINLGLDFSLGAGDFDIKNELTYSKNLVPGESDKWIFQGVLGTEWNFSFGEKGTGILGIEIFKNDLGVSNKENYAFLILTNKFKPLHLAKYYTSAWGYINKPFSFYKSSLKATSICNLLDYSSLLRLDYDYLHNNNLILSLFATKYFGNDGDEFHLNSTFPVAEIGAKASLPF